ncbi:MAG: hypothetical protein GPJ54_14320 [Candidatus Heimdallarchaeota archaeon]|nr:hypothetical protein [Candidatus Heimdallarchaeota archaeon]
MTRQKSSLALILVYQRKICTISLLLIMTISVSTPSSVYSQSEVIYDLFNNQWAGNDGDLWLQIQLKEIFMDSGTHFNNLTTSIWLSKALDVAEMEIDYIFNLTYYFSNPPILLEWDRLYSIQESGTLESFEIHFQFNDTIIPERVGNYRNHIEIFTDSIIDRDRDISNGGHAEFDWFSNETNFYGFTEEQPLETKTWNKVPILNTGDLAADDIESELQIPIDAIWISTIVIISIITFVGRKKIKSWLFRNSESS